MLHHRLILLLMIPLALLATSCGANRDYYSEIMQDPEARTLRSLVETTDDPTARAVAMEGLAGHLLESGGPEMLVSYLTTFVERNPDDPYGGLYLYFVAQAYLEEEAGPMAIHYFERIVHGYPDVVVKDVSIRQMSLRKLVMLVPDAENRARYYELLIDEFGSQMDVGLLYYRVAQTYEQLGEWEAAYAAYRKFELYPDTEIPGDPHAHRTISDRLKFYDSPKNWTVATADELRAIISWAIRNKDTRTLLKYQSSVSFFTRSWEQNFDDPNATPLWDLGELLRNSRRVSVETELDMDTDGDEALLYTYGWGALRIRTWYLYFRKVYFPMDPEIHGTWEWAGIYLGERL